MSSLRQGPSQVFGFDRQRSQKEMTRKFTHGIRYEVAQDVLGALLAHWSEAAAQSLLTALPASQSRSCKAAKTDVVIVEHVLQLKRTYCSARTARLAASACRQSLLPLTQTEPGG